MVFNLSVFVNILYKSVKTFIKSKKAHVLYYEHLDVVGNSLTYLSNIITTYNYNKNIKLFKNILGLLTIYINYK